MTARRLRFEDFDEVAASAVPEVVASLDSLLRLCFLCLRLELYRFVGFVRLVFGVIFNVFATYDDDDVDFSPFRTSLLMRMLE